MALTTKPYWDKYNGYVGNFRSVLAADINLETQANKVLAVGGSSTGIVIGSGQTGIKGVMVVAVGTNLAGTGLLDGGINNKAGDPCDVGKHGEITNFRPTLLTNSFNVVVTAESGTATLKLKNPLGVEKTSGTFAYNGNAAAVDSALAGIDDGLDTSGIDVVGTAPNFTVTLPAGWSLAAGTGTTVTAPSAEPAAFTNYYAHADGSITATKGGDGIYIGHTVEASRLIVNVNDATP